MHKVQIVAAILFLLAIFSTETVRHAVANFQPQIPTRLFDVRTGNGAIDNGTTYPQATLIVFKDKASKDAVIAAFADQYNYQATVPDPADAGKTIANPQNQTQFFNARLTSFIKEVYTASGINAATKTARENAKTAADAVVPPQ